MESDPFDDVLRLEEKFYDEGFQLGSADGGKAGRIEGRIFGLEKGFEKYLDNARLHGRSLVWISRINSCTEAMKKCEGSNESNDNDTVQSFGVHRPSTTTNLLPRAPNPRLEKHVRALYALTEPASLSTDNTEDAVSDFDDRFKRASGKMKIIESLVGEQGITTADPGFRRGTDATIEDANILGARH